MDAATAIEALRALRTVSVHTEMQRQFLHSYCGELWRRSQGVIDSRADDAEDVDDCDGGEALEVLGQKPPSTGAPPKLIVLMGLPGSGKSYLAKSLMECIGTRSAVLVNQDTLRVCAACKNAKSAKCVIVDRCNLLHIDRVNWLNVGFKPENSILIDMATDAERCKKRAARRFDHPTLVPDRAALVIDGVKRSMEHGDETDLKNGYSAVLVVRSEAAANEVVQLFT